MNPVSTNDPATARADLAQVVQGFHPDDENLAARCRPVSGDALPAPFDRLLNHTNHMTTTLGEFHGQPVALRVLCEQHAEDHYSREILLTLGAEGAVVEYGIARVNFEHASDEIRDQILEKRMPLGDILIAHDVLRTIRPRWFFQLPEDTFVAAHFGTTDPLFGRVGTIYFEDDPAIELLEVVLGERRA